MLGSSSINVSLGTIARSLFRPSRSPGAASTAVLVAPRRDAIGARRVRGRCASCVHTHTHAHAPATGVSRGRGVED